MISKYYKVKDDGADWKCDECGEDFSAKEVLACDTPSGTKTILCKECIEPEWLENAQYSGKV